MAIVAGMVLGSGPERGSTETTHALCLDGYWKGTWQDRLGSDRIYPVSLDRDSFNMDGIRLARHCHWVDEGYGRFKVTDDNSRSIFHGIYKYENGRFILCMGRPDKPRPTAFQAGNEKALLILEPAKPPE